MSTPVNGEVPSQFLAPLEGSNPVAYAEKNAAAAFAKLKAAHPGVFVNGPAGGYWTRAVDEAIHANPAKYGVTDKNLSAVGHSPHGLGTRLNIENVSPAVAKQFGFSEYNSYTFDWTGTLSWNEPVTTLDVVTLAHQVIAGDWGNGSTRTARLKAAGYDPVAVQTEVNALLNIKPTPTPAPKPAPRPLPAPTSPKAPTVTTPKPPTKAQSDTAVKALEADSAELATVGGSTNPLAGLLAGRTKLRKRAYVIYALASLVISFGPDVVTYGLLTAHATSVLVTTVGLSSSILLKIGTAFGLVAAANAKD